MDFLAIEVHPVIVMIIGVVILSALIVVPSVIIMSTILGLIVHIVMPLRHGDWKDDVSIEREDNGTLMVYSFRNPAHKNWWKRFHLFMNRDINRYWIVRPATEAEIARREKRISDAINRPVTRVYGR